MSKILEPIRRAFQRRPLENCAATTLRSLQRKVTVTDDTWNKVPNGQVLWEYVDGTKPVAHIDFRVATGQIGYMWVAEKYRAGEGTGMDLRTQMLSDAASLMDPSVRDVWEFTTRDNQFWRNVAGKRAVYQGPVHPTVTGSGYTISRQALVFPEK